MIGAVINSAGIVAGGVCALAIKKPIPNRFQLAAKIVLGVFTVWLGLQLTWRSLNGSVVQILKELCIVMLAMAIGKLAGRMLRLQELVQLHRAVCHPFAGRGGKEETIQRWISRGHGIVLRRAAGDSGVGPGGIE